MNTLWLFRSDIKHLEYYHQYKDLKIFEKNCHDFYLLMCLYYLKQGYFDQVIIWRVSDNPPAPITFDINGRKFHQFWVRNLAQTIKYPSPDISFWRGGFQIYDAVVKKHPKHFGKKIYLGAGRRRIPQWGGKYDLILMEDERDFIKGMKCAPFYKTASPEIFKPLSLEIEYDICWPCNFRQITQKGQEYFIKTIGQSNRLKHLKIVHCGNQPKVGRNLCKKYGVDNIEFLGDLDRPKLNEVLNQSKTGIVLSNQKDGCPRILTEIIMSGTPLLVRDITHFLSEYKKPGFGVVEFDHTNIVEKIITTRNNWFELTNNIRHAIKDKFSFEKTCEKNIGIWQKM
jgi:glycosyltransferase involved in cell wall biosynthesis